MRYIQDLGLQALGSRMRGLSDRLYALADEVYAARGIALQARWLPVLRQLYDDGPATVGDIAEAIGQTHSAVSQLADRLARDGWLRTRTDRRDRRRRLLALTPDAERVLRTAKPVWRALEEELADACAADGIDLLDTLTRFERLLTPDMAARIATRSIAHDPASVRIEPFTPALREHFYRLNEAWLRKYFYVEDIDHRVLSNPEGEILAPGGAILFALLGDEVIGTCALIRETEGVYELSKMSVEEGRQGLGIGRRLIEAAIAEFKRLGGTRLFLETNTKLTPAIRLYESTGFVHQPTTKPDSHYARSDVYMVWDDRTSAPSQE